MVLLTALMVADVGAAAGVALARYNSKTDTSTRTRTNDSVAMHTKTSFSPSSQVGAHVLALLLALPNEGGAVFASPYLLLRKEMGKVLNLLTDTDLTPTALSALCQRVTSECQNACQSSGQSGSVVVAAASTTDTTFAMTSTEGGDTTVTVASSTSSATTAVTNDTWKNACDCCIQWLSGLSQNKQSWRYLEVVAPLLLVAMEGCAHGDITFSKQCHNTCKLFAQRVKVGHRTPSDLLTRVLTAFSTQSEHPSLHIRETVMICVTFLLLNNSASMSTAEKKQCKDIFAKGMLDAKPEVQVLSRKGMVAYLSTKPIGDLTALAASYIKNCDILASREKKKRKLQKAAAASSSSSSAVEKQKPDDMYITTIAMSSCMVLAFPFDLPSYVPALLAAVVRHESQPAMKDLVTRTVQDFKSTHQDRWEEFKLGFSREQLEDLQGAGAAHYFS